MQVGTARTCMALSSYSLDGVCFAWLHCKQKDSKCIRLPCRRQPNNTPTDQLGGRASSFSKGFTISHH